MKILINLSTIFISFLATSQVQSINSQKIFGTLGQERLTDVLFTSSNLYLFSSPIDGGVDKTSPNFGSTDSWLVKMDYNYNQIWQKSFGGNEGEVSAKLVEMENGKILLGMTSGSLPSGNKTAPFYGGSGDFYLVSIDSNGDILWDKSFGGVDQEALYDLIKINNNRYFLLGTTNSGIGGNKTTPAYGGDDLYALLVDSLGNKIWEKTLGGSNGEFGMSSMYQESSNSIFIIANSSSGVSGNKTTAPIGAAFSDDIWAIKLDMNGNIMQQKAFGSDFYDFVRLSKSTLDNRMYFFASSTPSSFGNNTSVDYGGTDIWMVEFDSTFQILNQSSFGGDNVEEARGVALTEYGFVITSYSFSGSTGLKSSPSYGSADAWIIGVNFNGNLLWEFSAGGDKSDIIERIHEVSPNVFQLVGVSASSISGNKSVANYITSIPFADDIWLFKVSTTLKVSNLSPESDYLVYPNPFNDELTIKGNSLYGEAVIRIFDIHGRIVFEKNLYSEELVHFQLDVNPGIYHYTINDSNNHSEGKIIKN